MRGGNEVTDNPPPGLKTCPICGFTAYTKDLLDFFPKKRDGTLKDFCTICDVMYKHPLVVCKVCGLKAYTKEDLKHFVPRPSTKHGVGRICWTCYKEKNERAYNKRRDRLLKLLAEMANDEYLLNRLKRSGFINH